MNSNSNTILYLTGDKFQIYNNVLTRIIDFPLDPRFVQNKELVNTNDLQQELQSLIDKETIPAGNIIIVIAESASYASKPEGYNAIKEMFEKIGFKVDSIMPDYIYGYEDRILNFEYAAVIFRDTSKFSANNLLTAQIPAFMRPELPKYNSEDQFFRAQRKKDIMRLYAYTSIFGMLMIAILVVWYVNPLPQIYQGKAFLERYLLIPETSKLSMRVINCSDTKETATGINESMGKFIFKNVEVLRPVNQQTCPAQRNTIMFSGKVSKDARAAILYEVMKSFGSVLISDKDDTAPEIVIIIAK